MKSIVWVPGAVASPGPITIPATEPDIDAVVFAVICRLPGALTIPNHAAVAHGAGAADVAHTTTDLTALTDHDNNPTYHAVHAAAAVIAAIADHAIVAHGANVGASPVVVATPTKLTARTFSLSVSTVLGDILSLSYLERGERILTS